MIAIITYNQEFIKIKHLYLYKKLIININI